jgi:polysaccharide pyruvyl transferase CsaB
MSKFAVHGFYGEGNLGDEAILKALLGQLECYRNVEVVVFSKYPQKVAETHGVGVVSEHGGHSFLRRVWEIRTSNLFILGGGGLLKDYGEGPTNIRRWLRLLRLAQFLGVKTALWAVGVENIRSAHSKKLLRGALSKVDFISVRDENSKNILESIGVRNGVHVLADPALLLVDFQEGSLAGSPVPPRVMVSVRHWFNKGHYIESERANVNFIRSMSRAADFLVKNYDALIDFVPFRTTPHDDDRIIAAKIIAHMKHKQNIHLFSDVPQIEELIRSLHHYSLAIGMRLHSLIFATAAGIPAIGLEYMPKVKAYMQSIGQEAFSLPLETLTADGIIDRIRAAFQRGAEQRLVIKSNVLRLKKVLRENMSHLLELSGRKEPWKIPAK